MVTLPEYYMGMVTYLEYCVGMVTYLEYYMGMVTYLEYCVGMVTYLEYYARVTYLEYCVAMRPVKSSPKVRRERKFARSTLAWWMYLQHDKVDLGVI